MKLKKRESVRKIRIASESPTFCSLFNNHDKSVYLLTAHYSEYIISLVICSVLNAQDIKSVYMLTTLYSGYKISVLAHGDKRNYKEVYSVSHGR